MLAFRQRPLSRLFLIATACVDVMLVVDPPNDDLVAAAFFGQVCVLGGWFALGRTHRLARAAAFVVGLLLLTLTVSLALVGRHRPEPSFLMVWGLVMTSSALFGGAVAAATFGWQALIRWILPKQQAIVGQTVRFPLIELFGWTIVVAVGSVALRTASILDANYDAEKIIAILLVTIVASLLMALFLGNGRRPKLRGAVLIAIGVIVALYANLFLFVSDFDYEVAWVFAASHAYVGLWILVVRLDDPLEQKRAVANGLRNVYQSHENADTVKRPERPACDSPGRSPG